MNYHEDAEMIRFDGEGVDPVSVDSDSEPDENEESDEASDLDLVMPDNDESDYTDEDEWVDTWWWYETFAFKNRAGGAKKIQFFGGPGKNVLIIRLTRRSLN